jgi:hypothetical protein
MLRTTHKAIAERIACELGFSEENTEIFISGSTGIDTHGDFPHATGHNRKILIKIDTARTLFLQNDEYSTANLQTHFTTYETNGPTTQKLRPNKL